MLRAASTTGKRERSCASRLVHEHPIRRQAPGHQLAEAALIASIEDDALWLAGAARGGCSMTGVAAAPLSAEVAVPAQEEVLPGADAEAGVTTGGGILFEKKDVIAVALDKSAELLQVTRGIKYGQAAGGAIKHPSNEVADVIAGLIGALFPALKAAARAAQSDAERGRHLVEQASLALAGGHVPR